MTEKKVGDIPEINDKSAKAMTESLRLLNGDEKTAAYLRWIVQSDIAKEYWLQDKQISANKYILQQAVNRFGIGNQMDMAMEECAELIKAINKVKRSQTNYIADKENCLLIEPINMGARMSLFDMASEIADVELMIAQLKLMCPAYIREAVEVSKERKIDRLSERLSKFKP